jgi:mannose-6-phosphate isomerase-like protein (cupin superfamily)
MMTREQHFCFESAELKETIAHAGSAPILFQRAAVKADGRAFNFLDFTVVPVGADIGIHTHAHDNEEIYIIISGRGLMFVDGREFEVGPGHVVVNRPGGTHGLRNSGDTALRMVVLEIPAGDGTAAP